MLHTLLPIEERNALRREYRIRMGIVFCLVLAFSGIVAIGSIFPAFIKSANEQRTVEVATIDVVTPKKEGSLSSLEQMLARSQVLLSSLDSSADRHLLSSDIAEIIGLRGPITISSFAVDQTSSTTVQVTIRGFALTRQSLLDFKSRLENAKTGNKVDLPVTLLSKSSNIDFSLQLTKKIK